MGEGLADRDRLAVMYSIATGMMPAPMIAAVQAPAASTEPKPSGRARALGGAQDPHARSVTMPSCPSEPQIRPSRS